MNFSPPSFRATLWIVLFLVAGLSTTQTQALPEPTPTATPTNPAQPSPGLAEVIPPVPERFVTDEAHVVSARFVEELKERLAAFERETGNQFLVVVYPKMLSHAELGDYCTRVFRAWGVGQKGINNGVVLFVFTGDHKVRLSVGLGLEGPLFNAACQQIIEAMLPYFRAGNYEAALSLGTERVRQLLRTPPAQSAQPAGPTPDLARGPWLNRNHGVR